MSEFALTPIWDELVKEYEEREFASEFFGSRPTPLDATNRRHRLDTTTVPKQPQRDPQTGRYTK